MLRCPVDIVLSAERFQVDPAACCSAARNCARIDARTLCSAEVFPNEPFRTAKSRDAHRREDVPFLRRNSTPDRSLEVITLILNESLQFGDRTFLQGHFLVDIHSQVRRFLHETFTKPFYRLSCTKRFIPKYCAVCIT